MNDTNLEPRVVAVETKLDNVIAAIGELTNAVKSISARPQTIAWKEIAGTAIVTLSLFSYAGNYLEGQYSKNIALEKYRIEVSEKALCTLNPSFCVLLKR